MRKNLGAHGTNQNKKEVYVREGCILKIEGLQACKFRKNVPFLANVAQ